MIKHKHIITEEAKTYLGKQASFMKTLIELIGEVESYYIEDYFTALCNSIIYQSISFKAATAIWNRFVLLIHEITPTNVLSVSFDTLKDVGLSNSKTQYLFNIAEAFKMKTIDTNFEQLSDSEVIKELTKVKGIGPWTAEMFLIFCLNRPNVMSYGDIAIRRGLEFLLKKQEDITKKEFYEYVELFSPYNTTASLYIWELTLRDMMKKK